MPRLFEILSEMVDISRNQVELTTILNNILFNITYEKNWKRNRRHSKF